MSYSKKAMSQWKDKDVKAWVNSLDGFNDKQKKLICKGVDEIGCDGDSLESAETAEELKDALDIPIILARKLHRKVTAFKDNKGGNDDSDNDSDESSEDNKKKKKSAKKSSKKSSKKKKKKEESSSDEDSDDDSSSSDDDSDSDAGSDKDDNEEDVLARLIARNLAKKNKINPGSSQNDNSSKQQKKGGFLQWGSSNNSNNNSNNNSSFGGGSSSDKFIVNIQGSNGKYIQISTKCDKHTTVRQVKQYLAAQEGGDPAKMNLKFNGRNMDDHQNLGFYGIANSRNLITVSYKVVGGN